MRENDEIPMGVPDPRAVAEASPTPDSAAAEPPSPSPSPTAAPSFLKAAVAATPKPQADPDRLKALRRKVAEARDLEQDKKAIEERLTEVNIKLNSLFRKELPDLFDEVGVSAIELEPEGNYPGVSAKAGPYYKANIPASWPPERREDAFDCLKENDADDLIKTVCEVSFPRGAYQDAVAFANSARAQGFNVILKEDVPWTTLTAWLKEQVEKHGRIPPLDRIGGEVGRIVKLKTK